MTIEEVRMLALSREDQELLGIELLCTLESQEAQAEVDVAWVAEILARSDSYHQGKRESLDAAGTVDRLGRILKSSGFQI